MLKNLRRALALILLLTVMPAVAGTWDQRVQELTPAGGVCVTGLLAGVLQTAACTSTLNTNAGIFGGPIMGNGTLSLSAFRADGRLVASTGTPAAPVPTSSVINATSLWYVPSQNGGALITIYNGVNDQAYSFGSPGLVLGLGSNWTANSAFDVFAALSGGAPVLCTVGWTSLTARATALDGTTRPYLTNGISITCRTSNTTTLTVAANQGTYLGSFYTNSGPGQVDFNFGGSAVGGGAASLGVWNAYNQTPVAVLVQDSTASWSYNGATYRNADASAGNSVTFMMGLPRSSAFARYQVAPSSSSGGALTTIGIGINGAAPSGIVGVADVGTAFPVSTVAEIEFMPPLGQTTIQAQENAGGNTMTYRGAGQEGLSVRLMM
jgi:hypothetical protein